jgi:hypothetical protein
MALAGTPSAITQAMGYQIYSSSPEQVTQKIKTDIEKWTKVIKSGNIKPD